MKGVEIQLHSAAVVYPDGASLHLRHGLPVTDSGGVQSASASKIPVGKDRLNPGKKPPENRIRFP